MKTANYLGQLKAGDTVALLDLFGRRLAIVRAISREGFTVGRRQYFWDGRGRNHSDNVAVMPLPHERMLGDSRPEPILPPLPNASFPSPNPTCVSNVA
jgi:hypothetical protein